MAFDARKRRQLLAYCGEIRDDDGVDPRKFFKIVSTRNKSHFKAEQLCRQVAETLDQVLSGELDDGLLYCLRVMSVVPAPDSSRLLVTLYADCTIAEFDRPLIERRLAACKGRLRCEVSGAITRRKVPLLVMNLRGPDTAPLLENGGSDVDQT